MKMSEVQKKNVMQRLSIFAEKRALFQSRTNHHKDFLLSFDFMSTFQKRNYLQLSPQSLKKTCLHMNEHNRNNNNLYFIIRFGCYGANFTDLFKSLFDLQTTSSRLTDLLPHSHMSSNETIFNSFQHIFIFIRPETFLPHYEIH